MTKLRLSHPLWLDRAPRQSHRYQPLEHQLDVDVAIVGGGVTGAAVAWRLSSAGLRVAVLEARQVGRGSTAASTALLMQEPDEDFSRLRTRYGRRAARRIWELSQEATRDFIDSMRRLDIACGLAKRDSIYYTIDEASLGALRREHRDRLRAGIGSRWMDEHALRRATGIAGCGAIRTRGDAQADPLRVCLGLVGAAERAEALIFERSPVQRIDRDRRQVTLHTPRGAVRADQVIVATGYATPEFKPLLGRFRMLHTYVVASEPMPTRLRSELGLSDVLLWDTERPYHYARWSEDHRLILGGADRPQTTGRGRAAAFREGVRKVRSYFSAVYPALGNVRFPYEWEGLFAMTPDSLPYIGSHQRYPRHLFALGYGGNGMTFGFLAARLLLERLSGRVTPDHQLFAFGRLR